MAKKKELTEEELLQKEKERDLDFIKNEINFINEPSYSFEVGEEVKLGNLSNCIVDEIFYDGKVYGISCIVTQNKEEKKGYRVVPWHEVRPLGNGTTSFSKDDDVDINFNNTSIDSLIHKYYHFGIDMNPSYQRDYVWTDEDKEYLLESIFDNVDIGKFVVVHLDNSEWRTRGYSYEILDGKQRLQTLINFYENKLSYKGKYYNDLSFKDRHAFRNHMISVGQLEGYDEKTILKAFIKLNKCGKVMDKSQLDKVEKMYEAL